MSYTVYLQKFKNGDPDNIPFDELEKILSSYGIIEKGYSELEFVSNVGEMFEEATFIGNLEDGISGICFNKPSLNDKFSLLIFDLLKIRNTCFFGTDLKFVNSRYEMKTHLPQSLIISIQEEPKVISNAIDNWQLR
ncbi:hypothetical protein [Cellulophaga fucicola]|uniref:Uncharacterized protein n=1 Tax=Cellulophaga fucicola TaxID=76595 RepID=A0A1K1NNZ7_9FLAO|nr:hypothetical protein [Cellulophaga fucicola]SFW37028.1 hypothetical protein SAMN05660313_01279 [Cellulophaga fucicola]